MKLKNMKRPFGSLSSVALAVTILTSSPLSGHAQLANYIQDIHAKNYSIEKVPGFGPNYVIAGTYFDKGSFGAVPRSAVGSGIQFMYVNALGNLNIDPLTGFSVTRKYTFPEYADIRCVDVVTYTSSEAIIVAQARTVISQNPTHGTRDILLVLTVDISSGNLLSSRELAYNTPTQGDYGNIYATHAIYHEDKSNNNSYLYICGYDGFETQLNNYPEFIPSGTNCADKRILVMKYDIDNHAGNPNSEVIATRTWDYPWSTCTPVPDYPEIYDFDMAMRLVPIDDGSGDIYVTGSTNSDFVWYSNGSVSAAYPSYGSGTLSLRIDETDNGMGSGLNTVAIRPFIERKDGGAGVPSNLEVFEQGYGAFEDNTGNGLYVFSNEYEPNNSAGYGVKTSTETIKVTYVDKATLDFNQHIVSPGDFYPPCSCTVWHYIVQDYHRVSFGPIDYNWGTQVLESPNGTDKVYLAGLQSGWDAANCGSLNGNNPPTLTTNINPFMSELEPTWTTGATNNIGINSVNFWKTYFTQDGTSYFDDLGGGLSNITWATEFVAKTPNLLNISFMAPRWDKARSVVGVKYITTDENGDMPATTTQCANSFQNCTVNYSVTQIYDAWYFGSHVEDEPVVVASDGVFNDVFTPATPVDCDGGGLYKPTTIENVNQSEIANVVFDVYPNPAQSFVNVKLNGVVGEGVQVTVALYNLMGQQVAELYTGAATGLETERKLDLPSVSSGVYMLIISSEGVDIQTERLSIH